MGVKLVFGKHMVAPWDRPGLEERGGGVAEREGSDQVNVRRKNRVCDEIQQLQYDMIAKY